MEIEIIRGQNQIGGSIILIRNSNTKLYFDIGRNLDEDDNVVVPRVEGLFNGAKDADAVFISHYHADHVGLIDNLLPGINVYMGDAAYKILSTSREYVGNELKAKPIVFTDGKKIKINDIGVTPILCDHSAYDSYMFLIEEGNKKILYTGDYRANGRMDFNKLLDRLNEVDAVITEGTTLSRDGIKNITEDKLEEIGTDYLNKHKGPCFIVQAGTNIERIRTALNIASKSNRLLLMDPYVANIVSKLNEPTLSPVDNSRIKVFPIKGGEYLNRLNKFRHYAIYKKNISRSSFVMVIRPSMIRYLKKINELMSFNDGVLFYGMWLGYKEKADMKLLLDYLASKGVNIHTLHTSGHADSETIDSLIKRIKPKYIIPVHTTEPAWFNRYNDISKVIINESEIEI